MQIILSKEAQQRIADGTSLVGDEAMKELCMNVAVLTSMSDYVPPNAVEQALRTIEEGKVDCLARVQYVDVENGHLVEEPLLVWMIKNCSERDMSLLEMCLQKASPNMTDNGNKPAYAYAFDLATRQGAQRRDGWTLCAKHPKLDLEIEFEQWRRLVLAMTGGATHVRLSGTLVNQECVWMRELREEYGRYDVSGDHKIEMLLEMGALLAPEFADDPAAVAFKQKWEAEFQELRTAIVTGDEGALMQALSHGGVRAGFSLGRGPEMCRREFWGAFWSQGCAEVMDLPDWAQQRLMPDILMVMHDLMPDGCIREWTHETAPLKGVAR